VLLDTETEKRVVQWIPQLLVGSGTRGFGSRSGSGQKSSKKISNLIIMILKYSFYNLNNQEGSGSRYKTDHSGSTSLVEREERGEEEIVIQTPELEFIKLIPCNSCSIGFMKLICTVASKNYRIDLGILTTKSNCLNL
jgi:hypothetical protein